MACPTWAEVQRMDPLELQAINIIKGEANGDTFEWDHEWIDDEGFKRSGRWKSAIDKDSGKVVDE